jgi:hypothetical protein
MNVCVEVQITVLCNGGGFLVHPVRDPDLVCYEQKFYQFTEKILKNFYRKGCLQR